MPTPPSGKRLAELVTPIEGPDFEAGRAAKRAMWKIVRSAGRPGAAAERRSAVEQLLSLLDPGRPAAGLCEVLRMLSEIGGDESVGPLAALLSHAAAREDARMALERIPGERSLAALREALAKAGEDFKPALAQSLRARGVEVPGVPCLKLRPVKPTRVRRAGAERSIGRRS